MMTGKSLTFTPDNGFICRAGLALVLIAISQVMGGCAPTKLPPLVPLPGNQSTNLQSQCRAIYPSGQWQFVHSIDFTMANGYGSTLLGITSLGPDKLACALLTPEGLTLFQAQMDDQAQITVDRAVPPFDNQAFATGLLTDVRTIFLAPNEKNSHYGQLTTGQPLCRYQGTKNATIDLMPQTRPNICWQIKTYDEKKRLTRTIIARKCQNYLGEMIPMALKLSRPGNWGYTLKMRLLRAEKQPSP